jgi:hypothetical protein
MIMQVFTGADAATDAAADTTKAKRKRGKAEQMTMAQRAELRMQEALEAYRAIVTRSANGAELENAALDDAAELLERLSLPSYCLERDTKAQQDYDATSLAEIKAKALLPEAEQRAPATVKRIQELEKELEQLRQQLHQDVHSLPRRVADHGRRRHELAAFHPHLFLPVADAARLRLQALDKARPMPAEPLGWSTT